MAPPVVSTNLWSQNELVHDSVKTLPAPFLRRLQLIDVWLSQVPLESHLTPTAPTLSMPSSAVDLRALPLTEQQLQSITQSSSHAASETLRLGLTECYGCVFFEKEFEDIFHSWWATTYYGQRCLRCEQDFPKPNFGLRHRQSEAWNNVVEAAERSTGTPCDICARCKTKLVHSNNYNTSAGNLKTHFASATCQITTVRKQLPERRVQTVLEVSTFSLLSEISNYHPVT